MNQRPPLPPFDLESAKLKVRLAEDGWNSRDPENVSLAYSVDSVWRNRAEFVIKFWIDQPLGARFIKSAAEVELAQLRNRICKRESYQLEAVQYDCASTGSGKSLNRFTMGHRIGCS
jgi:nuclear transport factor 2 (NTF2) superfamily protein